MQGIYKFTNRINKKIYIGKADNLEERFKSHKRNYNNSNLQDYNTKFYRALRKYGFENFDYEILESNKYWTEEVLNQKEIEYIDKYQATKDECGYNIQKGGLNTAVPRKLNEKQILEIKNKLITSVLTMQQIAKEYRVSDSMISMINSGKAWATIGATDFPLRKDIFIKNKGGSNPRAKFSDKEIMQIRLMFVEKQLNDIYEIYKERCSFSEMKKICYGVQFQHLPIYKKRQKQWILNGTCIDYPRLEEY